MIDKRKTKRMLRPQWILSFLLAIVLVVGSVGLAGCAQTEEQPSAPVIEKGGKELTILSSTVIRTEYKMLAVATVENTGSEPIRYAELEMEFYDVSGEPYKRHRKEGEWSEYARFVIKNLAVGEVQTLYAGFLLTNEGSIKVKVNKLQ